MSTSSSASAATPAGDQTDFLVDARAPGTTWAFQSKLGEGGMGVVYGVVNDAGVEGAMKVMLPSLVRTPERVARFLQEARVLASLKHPNIVRVIDFDRLADGTPFVVMERLKGRTLGTALRALRQSSGVAPSLAYEVIRQLCEGLHFAHSHDPPIVHRDVKPENVFVHRASADTILVKLIDFGIAAVIDGKEFARALGTPRYLAPELLLGEPASPQSDIYSAALLLYQMLTDRFPWDADIQTASAMAKARLTVEPAPPSRYGSWIPAAVDESVLQALARDPRARPSSAHDFSASLCVLQFVDERRSKREIDVDSTPLTRERDLVDLAALAGVASDPPRTEQDDDPSVPQDLTVTTVMPDARRRPLLEGGVLFITALLVASIGVSMLAHSSTVALRDAPASHLVPRTALVAAGDAPAAPARREAPLPATVAGAPVHATAGTVARGRSHPERTREGGIELAAPDFIPSPPPAESGELPFLPDRP